MLCISRKIGQLTNLSIESNGGFMALGSIVVTKVQGNKVTLGLELRKDVKIVRDDAKNQQGKERAA